MKTKNIITGIAILIVAGIFVGFISSPSVVQTHRGKVLSGGESNINSPDYKIIKASFSPFQAVADSTDIIEGEICILNENDEPTGNTVQFQPRRFPKWFEFGCEDEGDFIEYNLVANGTKAIITRFPGRNE
jgi:hypothetical protein